MQATIWLRCLQAAAAGGMLGLALAFPQETMAAVRESCRLWAGSVMPALFPYLALSQWLCASVHAPALTVPLAMLGGSPAGARLIALGGFSPARAQRLAALCVTASPLFVLGTLRGGARMLAAHWLGAVAAWGFARLTETRRAPADSPPAAPERAPLSHILRDAAMAMVAVCACMAFFAALGALLFRLVPLPPAWQALAASLLEMAGGCARIEALGLPERLRASCQAAAVSFGGLSIFLQNALYLRPAGVRLPRQLAARVVHALAAFCACWALYRS